MKKLFLFATIAAAGLFASCSSSDDAISEAANNPIEDIDGDKQAIKISMGNLGNIVTRGTGTVGGVENGSFADNIWAGQHINVFMFDKDKAVATTEPLTYAYTHTLRPTKVEGAYLYNNSVMVTPGSDENLIPGMRADANVSSGEAMLEDGTINYYPTTGNFDFFGYHGDDAVATNAVIKRWNGTSEITGNPESYDNDTKWTVEFNINGSQDLMSTKAQLTASQAATYDSKDYFSAKAARKGIQPTLTFNHLLTRFAFKVKAAETNPEAAGWMKGVEVKNAADVVDPTGWTVLTYTKKAVLPTLTTDQYNALTAEYKTWFTKNATSGNYEMTGGFTNINKDTYDSWIADLPTYDNSPLKDFYEAKTYIKEDADPTAHPESAVKVKSIQIFSKTKGEMAVAWKDGDDHAVTSYEMGIILPATYDALDASHKTDWEAVGDPVEYYKWVGGEVNAAKYATLADAEKAVATAVHGNTLTDSEKIVFDENEANGGKWLTLKARPYAKIKSTPIAAEYADFTNGATLNTAVTDATTDYNAKKAVLDDMQSTDAGYAAQEELVATALAVKTKAENDLADLLALEEELISEAVWLQLSTDGKAKYKELTAKEQLNEQLIAVTPTAPTWDNTAAAGKKSVPKAIGEALIVAPKGAATAVETTEYKMRVTVVQKKRDNWNSTAENDVEVPYELTIKSPGGGFKINYSYNIILTVYSLERIEVIAEITPWIQDADDINYDPDAD